MVVDRDLQPLLALGDELEACTAALAMLAAGAGCAKPVAERGALTAVLGTLHRVLEQPEGRNSVSSLLNILQVDPPTLALPRPARTVVALRTPHARARAHVCAH